MGIKGLNAFLRKKCPEAFVELPITYFRGKRIAIDSDNVLRKLMSRAHAEIIDKTDVSVEDPNRDDILKRWVYHVKIFVINLLNSGITPIFVFDGKYIPAKSKTQAKRRFDKNKIKQEAQSLKDSVRSIDELERTPAMITQLRKKMRNLGYMSSADKEFMIEILSGIGLPILKAVGEGEQLCAVLCIEGKVDAAYSRDTDLVAFGCPLTINEPGGYIYNKEAGRAEESFKCTLFKPILSVLGLEYETFLDLCIMSGCDFNDNIYKVGVGRSYPILQKCKSIDNLPPKYSDKMECLNHVECREIFKRKTSEESCQNELNININYDIEEARKKLESYDVDDWINDISMLYRNFPSPSEVFIIKRPSLSSSRIRLNIGGNFNNNNQSYFGTKNKQRSSPKRITTKKINTLSKNQHSRIKQRLGLIK